ncbi:MAG: nucleotidyltransferase family protein, partial [Bacteroidota bacterium]
DRVIVVTGHEQEAVSSVLENDKLSFIHNEQYAQGQLTSIQKGLSLLSDECDVFMICLSDMPLLTSDDYNHLIHTYDNSSIPKPIVVPHNRERAGNPKLFHIDYKNAILALDTSKHQGAKIILQQNREKVIAHKTNSISFFLDIDTPDVYKKLIDNS